MPPWVLSIRNCGRPSWRGSYPIPAFWVSPKSHFCGAIVTLRQRAHNPPITLKLGFHARHISPRSSGHSRPARSADSAILVHAISEDAKGLSLRHRFAESPVAQMTLRITVATTFDEVTAQAGGVPPALFA